MNDMQLIYSRHNVDHPISEMYGKTIPFYDLTIVLRGSLYYTLDGKETTVSAGDAVLMQPGTFRQRRESHERLDYISFNFTTDSPPALPEVMHGIVAEDITLLVAAYDSFPKGALTSNKEKYMHILSCLLLTLGDRVRMGSFSPLTQQIIDYIGANLGKKITLADIGAFTFFSPVYCDTVFRQDVGRPIMDYVLESRISEAKRLLATADGTPLSAIAELVGFTDYNYFCRTFKKRTRYTPTEYRRAISG